MRERKGREREKARALKSSRKRERERAKEWKREDDEGSHDISLNSSKYPCLSLISMNFFIKLSVQHLR